ncbi:hypothetical protein QFE97_13375 [Bacillus subtilis]|nr:hypothetical protein QFE97_13375 [Bacillus subtilis]
MNRRNRFGGDSADDANSAGSAHPADGTNSAAASAKGKTGRSPYSAMHTGPGRALTAVYGVFALSATARAGYQLIREFDVAPIAYSLSALAAVIYILATVCLVIGNRISHRIAVAACAIEFVGVIVVGILSHTHPEDFAKPSVWSNFGSGYGYIPLILPLIGLWWLLRVGRRANRD